MEAHDDDTPQISEPSKRKPRRSHPPDEPPANGGSGEADGGAQPPTEKSPSTGFATLARTYRDVAPYLGLGIQLAATIVLCFFIGRWLDQSLNTAPWLTIAGALLGATGGLYNFLKTVIELGKKQNDKAREREQRQ
jgi:ATP synthase protein I